VASGAPFEHEALEVRQRLRDREAPGGRLQVVAEERERDLIGGPGLALERRHRRLKTLAVVRQQFVRPRDRVGEWLAVPRERQRGLEVDRRPERVEVVPERIGAARRPEADGRRDTPEQVVGGDQHALPEQHQLAVGVTRGGNCLPAVDDVTGIEQVGVRPVADERPVGRSLLDQLVRHVRWDAVPAEPVDEHVAPVLTAPDERALGVVHPPLRDGRSGQLRQVGSRADVVGVEVRDDDPADRRAVQRSELGSPAVARVGEPEPRVDDRPAALAREEVRVHVSRPVRERERHAPNPAVELVHGATLRTARRAAGHGRKDRAMTNPVHKRSSWLIPFARWSGASRSSSETPTSRHSPPER
jgi:hypothetical protein